MAAVTASGHHGYGPAAPLLAPPLHGHGHHGHHGHLAAPVYASAPILAAPAAPLLAAPVVKTGDYAKVASVSGIAPGFPTVARIVAAPALHAPLHAPLHHPHAAPIVHSAPLHHYGHHAPLHGHHGLLGHGHGFDGHHGLHAAAIHAPHAFAGTYSKVATVTGLAPGFPTTARIVAAPALHAPLHHGHHGLLGHGHGHGHGFAGHLTAAAPLHAHAAPLTHHGHHLGAPLTLGPHSYAGQINLIK